MTLYELTGQYMQLFQLMEDPDIDEQAIRDTLEGMDGEYDDKIDGWCRVIKSIEAEMKALKEESKRLAERSKGLETKIGNMKSFIYESMKNTGKTEAGTVLKAKIRKNGGVAPLVFDEGVTPESVPEIFQKRSITFDNETIRDALNADQVLGFVHLGERGESLQIK